ncbi:hypothetical protein ACIRFF_11905 [Streptomyces cyaneofuscatus]
MVQRPDTAARATSIGQSGSGRDARKDPVGLCDQAHRDKLDVHPEPSPAGIQQPVQSRAEPIRNKGPWTGINDVEVAVAEYVDRRNQRRLHGELGHITPAEHKAAHYATEPPASLQRTS